jgi:hypothetical protein
MRSGRNTDFDASQTKNFDPTDRLMADMRMETFYTVGRSSSGRAY